MQNKNFSAETAPIVDQEVKDIINEARTRCHDLLRENSKYLHAIAEALLERETISGDDIELIMEDKPLPPLDLKGNDKKAAPETAQSDFIFDAEVEESTEEEKRAQEDVHGDSVAEKNTEEQSEDTQNSAPSDTTHTDKKDA